MPLKAITPARLKFLNRTVAEMLAGSFCRYHTYGGQLRKLQHALTNPLEQQTGITLIGDSITWGLAVPGNALSTPRNHTLADPRDYYATKSWANELKRGIAEQYFPDAAAVLSNWSYSTAGESTATYSKTIQLYTKLAPFTTTVAGGTSTEADMPGTLLGHRHMLGILPSGSTAEVSFTFTGSELTVVFATVNSNDSADYELFVDGVSNGVFSTFSTPLSLKNKRTHTFGYVRNKTIRIAARYPAGGSGVNYLNLEGIEVNKTCTIATQGVIGTDAREYLAYNFGAFGPTLLTPETNFAFVQLGTNDRRATLPNGQPNDENNFKRNLVALLAAVTPAADAILMCAPPTVNDSAPAYAFSMGQVRSTVSTVAKEGSIDMIDNYGALAQLDLSLTLADGLHPNETGHAIIANNILNAIRSA